MTPGPSFWLIPFLFRFFHQRLGLTISHFEPARMFLEICCGWFVSQLPTAEPPWQTLEKAQV
jgi:hypothetical protein